jgi:virginiamycin B lyase
MWPSRTVVVALVAVVIGACTAPPGDLASAVPTLAPPSVSLRSGCTAESRATRAESDVVIGTPPAHITLPPGAGPTDIAALADGSGFWFSDSRGSRVGRMTLAGHLTLWSIPGSAPGFLAVEGAGAWVPDQAGGAILHITAAGVTRCLLPKPNANPFSVVLGPDGELWIAEKDANAIARMTKEGAVVEYPVPALPGGPIGLVLGPDGNIWFTEESGGSIGRVTMKGDITLYLLPDRATGVGRIVLGPDGAMWFAQYSGGTIGRVAPDGTVRLFPLPDANGGPNGLIFVNNSLYVTESTANAVVRFELDGRSSHVATTGAFPDGIVYEGGLLWIVEYNAGDLFVLAP